MLASVVANVNRGKGQRPYKAAQFIPQWDEGAPPERAPEMSPDEMLRAIRRTHKAMGGK